jgi:hypothetical protein
MLTLTGRDEPREDMVDADVDDRRRLSDRTETWLLRRGLPHLIDDYSATTDVFTRAVPFLTVVFVAEVFFTFDEDRGGLAELLPFLGGMIVLFGAAALVNRMRGRRLFQRPDRVGAPELALFVLVPPLLPLLFTNDRLVDTTSTIVANLVILGVTYVVTSYGLVPMTRWAIGQMFRQIGDLADLMVRSLPLLLLFSAFLFLNAEIWQVANDFEAPFFWIVIVLLTATGTAFLLLRLPSEVEGVSEFASWPEVTRQVAGSPVEGVDPPEGPVPEAPLGRDARVNVGLVLVFSQSVQVLSVGLIIGLFYVVFGLFTVREETILQWTTDPPDVITSVTWFGQRVVLTWELVRVSAFIAAFSALQFTVAALTDDTYRREFFEDTVGEIREALAVRVLYLGCLVGPREPV